MAIDPGLAAAGISAATDLVGGLIGQRNSNKALKKQYKYQKEFAQNAIQWKVADATAAGLHPLAALGAQVSSYAPVSVGDSMGPSLQSMGQNIGRAVEAHLTPEDKLVRRAAELAVENSGLQNDLLREQIVSQRMRTMREGTPGLPVLPGDPLLGGRNVDPEMNKRLQDRHGEMADVMTAPHSVVEVLSQPGNIADPALAMEVRKVLQHAVLRDGVLDLSRLFYPAGHPQTRKRSRLDRRY